MLSYSPWVGSRTSPRTLQAPYPVEWVSHDETIDRLKLTKTVAPQIYMIPSAVCTLSIGWLSVPIGKLVSVPLTLVGVVTHSTPSSSIARSPR